VYADAAKFDVEIPNPSRGPFLKCSERGTHIVQLAFPSSPYEFIFSHNVSQKPEGFIVGNLQSNTDYLVRVACKFNGATQPGVWSEATPIHTTVWTSKITGGSYDGTNTDAGTNKDHHHHHHDHQHDGNDNASGASDSSKTGNSSSSRILAASYFHSLLSSSFISFLILCICTHVIQS